MYAFFFKRAPRRDVGVMVQCGDDDFVARVQLAADGSSQREGDGGHVLAETYFIGGAIEKIGHGLARAANHGVVAPTGGEGSAGVGVIVEQIILNSVDDLLGDLRACGAVKKSGGLAVDLSLQGRKLLADPDGV